MPETQHITTPQLQKGCVRDVRALRVQLGLDPGNGASADEPPLPIRVCVLSSSYEGSTSAMKEWDNIVCGPQHFLKNCGCCFKIDVVFLTKSTVYKDLRAIVTSNQYDVFYNLCDGGKDEDRAGIEVVQALEEFRVPFTGAASKFFEMNKATMKMVAFYNGILAPRGVVVRSVGDARKCTLLRFPVIIKHICGYGSVGMTRDSKCVDMVALERRLVPFLQEFKLALVEEFITGGEATVLACADDKEPDGIRVFEPVMVQFPPGEEFKHFDLKWVTADTMKWLPMNDHPAVVAIKECGRKAFRSMCGAVGYGRCDVRINADNEVFFLEINPNCGMLYPHGLEGSADFIMQFDPTSNHEDFILTQIRVAVNRCKALMPKYHREYDPVLGYHLVAEQFLPKGSVVLENEAHKHRIVSKEFALTSWCEDDKKHFLESAWPLDSEHHLYGVWDEDPENWRPIAHSCNPNIGMGPNGTVNVVTLRDVSKDEPLTIDYATFSGKSFNCKCGASNCRGHVTSALPSLIGSD